MATKQEIATEVETQKTAIMGGTQTDLYEEGVPYNSCTHAIRYSAAEGGFFYVTKDASKPDLFMDAETIYELLYASAQLKLESPDYQADKPAFAAAQAAKMQARIDADKA